jgi:hypothetical protein
MRSGDDDDVEEQVLISEILEDPSSRRRADHGCVGGVRASP